MEFGPIHSPLFWKMLETIFQAPSKIELRELYLQTDGTLEDFTQVMVFLQARGFEIKTEVIENKEYVIKGWSEEPQINFQLSITDWWRLQAHFPLFHYFSEKPFHQKLIETLATIEKENQKIDLYEHLKQTHQTKPNLKLVTNESSMELELKNSVEESIKLSKTLSLKLKGHNDQFDVFPLKLTILEGGLSLIAEEISEKTLVFFPLNKIDHISFSLEDYQKPIHGHYEVEEFIESIRFINGNEIRLVLKILEPEKASELVPLYHYLRKPYVISNPRGELIWAASVEETEDLFEWLSNLKSKVEILDPISFKRNFLDFCEKKLKNIA